MRMPNEPGPVFQADHIAGERLRIVEQQQVLFAGIAGKDGKIRSGLIRRRTEGEKAPLADFPIGLVL